VADDGFDLLHDGSPWNGLDAEVPVAVTGSR